MDERDILVFEEQWLIEIVLDFGRGHYDRQGALFYCIDF